MRIDFEEPVGTNDTAHSQLRQAVGDGLQPLLAGAHARGVADALELLGIPAALIDDSGTVLHLAASAARTFGGDIGLMGGHIVGSVPHMSAKVARLIESALHRDGARADPLAFLCADGSSATMDILCIPPAWYGQGQLMAAIVTFTPALSA